MPPQVAAEPLATRRELDQLRHDAETEHVKLWARIEGIDDHGTRGVQGLAIRMDGLIKDVADLKSEVRADVAEVKAEVKADVAEVKSDLEAHQRAHETEAQERRDNRHWRVMAWIGGSASFAAVLGLLIDIAAHVH